MGEMRVNSVKCSGCSEPLSDNHVGSCPKCGDSRKTHDVHIKESLHLSGSLGWKHIHEYYERHKLLFPILLVITFSAPFLGVIFAGLSGVIVGLAISAATFFLGLKAITKVREIREGKEL